MHAYIISQIFEFFTCFFKKTEKISKSPKAFKDPENIMKKDDFLKLLQARLIERGLTPAAAEKETQHVRTYLAESSMDDVDISIDEMADGILTMLEDNSDSDHEDIDISPVPMVSEENDESVSDELSAAIAAIDSPAEEQPEVAAEAEPEMPVIPIVIETEPEIAPEPEEEPAEIAPVIEETPEEIPEPILPVTPAEQPAQTEAPHPEEPKHEVEAINEQSELPVSDEENEEIEKYIPYNQKVRMKKIENSKKGGNEWLYVLLLVITIPIAVALILTAAVLYLGFWVVLALAMIACIAVLVVFVTVFAIIAIVGIVYGVVALITGNMPVGLFEIGLGVMVGAAVMFIGILVYNFAVRFIPFIMKLLARLFRAGFRAIRNGYQVLKGAVEEL